jgi:Flp pilus assembly pilin Flp
MPAKRELLRDFASDEDAATSIEYALIAVILTGGLVISLPLVSLELVETFTMVTDYFVEILGG